ncbi:MAG: tripartite tricarboxylate transporter permease, partial [Rhodobacteraceae bacterium]|nr:tripartite tricarboxylate transporter permease [Paracoccaceae bacterium]
GNIILVIINLPLVRVWVALLEVPYRILFPAIVVFCCVGVYTIANSTEFVMLLAFFGLVGFAFHKFGFEPAPLLLGFVLGKMIEENLRRALILSRGDATVFLREPLSLVLLVMTVGLLLLTFSPKLRKGRETVLVED